MIFFGSCVKGNIIIRTSFKQPFLFFSVSVILVLQDYFQGRISRTVYRQATYRIIFDDPGSQRYIRDISATTTDHGQVLPQCFEMLAKYTPDAIQCVLLDSHPRSPLKKFPVRANFLPDKDGRFRPLLFEK